MIFISENISHLYAYETLIKKLNFNNTFRNTYLMNELHAELNFIVLSSVNSIIL